MKISEMIAHLQAMLAEHGDLDVETYGYDSDRIERKPPEVDYRAVLKGKEWKKRFASYFFNEPDRKGDKVCKL